MATCYPKNLKVNHIWTSGELDYVRLNYQGTQESAQAIADRLGVSFYAVKGQVANLGLSMNIHACWSPVEEERLTEFIYKYSPHQIAKKMKRSINSVVIKSKRLHLSRRVRDGWYTKLDVCEIVGVDHHKVQNWIDSGELKATWHGLLKPQKNGRAMWHIDEKALRNFLIQHSMELTGRNVDLFTIVNIVAKR